MELISLLKYETLNIMSDMQFKKIKIIICR